MTRAISQENVLRCLLSKLNSNEFSIFEIVGFIDHSKILIKKKYVYYDNKGEKCYKRILPPISKENTYLFKNHNGKCNIDINKMVKTGYPTISKRTRAGIHRAIDKLNAKFSSLNNSKEKNYLITKPKDNLFRLDELKFFNWMEGVIKENYSYSEKEEFLKWLKESILNKDASLNDLSKGAFYTKSKTGSHSLLLINPIVILNRIYLKDGKVNLKMKPKEVYLGLLEYLISLMSQKYEFHSKTLKNDRKKTDRLWELSYKKVKKYYKNTPKHPKSKGK